MKKLVRKSAQKFTPNAWRTLAGYEAVNMIRKGQVRRVGKGEVAQQLRLVAQLFELTA